MNILKSTSYTLSIKPWGSMVEKILGAALSAVDPEKALLNKISRDGHLLIVEGRTYDLSAIQDIYVIGAGKAAEPMARAVARVVGDRITKAVVITKDGYAIESTFPEKIKVLQASHPIPDERGIQATQEILSLLDNTHEEDLVICLISGGGSSLMLSPSPGVTLPDFQKLTSALLASGATIHEINTIRKHLDQVKGGQLARRAAPASVLSLILSDVVGDDLDIIASGPTVPDSSRFSDAYSVLKKHNLLDQTHASIRSVLLNGIKGLFPETPKPGDPLFSRVQNVIIGNNHLASLAAAQEAHRAGFEVLILTNYLQGESRQVGRVAAALLLQIARHNQPLARPACLILGGETTVTLKGSGLGGRNLELALSTVEDLANVEDIALVTLATDGGDGPTDAAGAIVTGESYQRAKIAGVTPSLYLKDNDSYHFFKLLGDLLITGPTQTNVNDLIFLFAF